MSNIKIININDRGVLQERFLTSNFNTLTVIVNRALIGKLTSAKYLETLPAAQFKPGHTLPQQSNFGYNNHFTAATAKLLADNFNYNLRFPGYLDDRGTNPNVAGILAIYDSNPSKYKVGVLMRGSIPGNASTTYKTAANVDLGYYSPWYDQAATDALIAFHTPDLTWAKNRFNVGIIQNPAEYGLSVPASALPLMYQDGRYPGRTLYNAGETDIQFVNRRKSFQETQLANAVRTLFPARDAYQNYNFGGIPDIGTYVGADQYGFDFNVSKTVTDYPCGSLYYSEFNDGFIRNELGGNYGGRDLWTQSVANYHQQLAAGKPLSINYVSGGWSNPIKFYSRIDLYRGYLKSLYMLGNISTITGFFNQFSEQDIPFYAEGGVPHWLTDLVSAGYVQATFSWLEDYLRAGTLLPGDGTFRFNPALPSYEFNSGSPNTRILVRKLNASNNWLISAWSADGVDRDVSIVVPVLGTVRVLANATANLYTCSGIGASPVLVPYQPNDGLEYGYIVGDGTSLSNIKTIYRAA